VAEATGDIPQNVNFAVALGTLQSFLDANNVQYEFDDNPAKESAANIAPRRQRTRFCYNVGSEQKAPLTCSPKSPPQITQGTNKTKEEDQLVLCVDQQVDCPEELPGGSKYGTYLYIVLHRQFASW